MALTESNMLALGTDAPAFSLPDTVSGETISLADGKTYAGTLVMFICNHCPYVIHINEELVRLAHDLAEKNIRVIAISSNDVVNYPQDGPEKMKEHAAATKYPFPYLYDESQEVAKAYMAACTPDFYLFDGDLKLYYRGRLDRSRPGNDHPVDGADMRAAVTGMLAGEPIPADQFPSAGCNIKWKR